MWCRAILATAALTCTFVNALHAHSQPQIKDIVCLLVLNGLQKDDLDVNTLKKLQRHNVNIDDMNNEDLRKECETTSVISSTFQLNEDKSDKPPDLRNKNQKPKLSDSSLQNIIINYFNNAQKSNKPNDSETIKTSEPKLTTELPDFENFLNLWNKFIKTRRDDTVATTTEEIKSTNSETTIKRNIRSDDSSMEYINNVLQNLISRKKTTTTDTPTTKRVDYHLLAQKIQELLAETRKQNAPPSEIITSTADEDRVNETRSNNPPKIFGAATDKNTNSGKSYMDTNVSYHAMKNLVDDGLRQIKDITDSPNLKYIKQTNNQQIKSLSDDIVKEISESIKAKVLQDLRNEMVTSTMKPNEHLTAKASASTIKQAVRSSIVVIPKQEKVKVNTTNMLETIMEMFQKFKAKDFTSPTNKALPQTIQKTDFLQSPDKFPPKYITPSGNIYQIDSHPVTMSSVVLNPYLPHAPNLQTGILPNPYSFLHINTPVHGTNGAKPVHKITQLNIFNTRNNYHTPPQTIQTNSVEIHPLGLPAQQSFVYQNIVVTTKNPFEKYKNLHITSHDKDGNNEKYKEKLPPHSFIGDVYKDFSFGGQARSRETKDDEYYRDSGHKQNRHRDYGRIPYNHNRERFHEKLERIDEWPRISRENKDEEYSTPKLVTRHQIPLNDAKRRPRFDDEHFNKFLKTQQKVNDMLERILATKTIDHLNRARSVEIGV